MILTVATIKGGTGKSTTAAALLQAAAHRGKRVLAVDLDPQSNLTYFLAADQRRPGTYNLLHGSEATELLQHTDQGLDVVSGSADLAAEITKPGSSRRLKAALDPLKDQYDLIMIDTGPNIGDLQFNALYAADGLIIPVEADTSSLQGLYQITDIARHTSPELAILGTVITRYDNRPKLSRYLKDGIEAAGETIGAPLLATIRAGVAIKEAQAMQRSLYTYAPKSKPAQDYLNLYNLIMKQNRKEV